MTVSANGCDKTGKQLCYMGDRPGIGEPVKDEDWDLESLKMILGDGSSDSGFKLCKNHKAYCEKRIPELAALAPIEKFVEKVAAVAQKNPKRLDFIPKKIAPVKDFQQRAANDGSLIE